MLPDLVFYLLSPKQPGCSVSRTPGPSTCRQNETPSCLVDFPAYSILHDTRGDNTSGKRTHHRPSDLSSCVAFRICGKVDVFSLPHMDHHGVLTKKGKKVWLIWPGISHDDLAAGSRADLPIPLGPAPFPLYLDPEDLLIQPPGRMHAPYSMTDELITGTAHWDSRRMTDVLRQSAYEFDAKIETIERL